MSAVASMQPNVLAWLASLAQAAEPGLARAVLSGENSGVDAEEQSDIRQSQNGDGQAYRRLVVRHQGEVAQRMRRFTRDPAQLEELVQEVFVQAYFSLPKFRGDSPFAHYLARIGTRAGYRFWKEKQRKARQVSLADWDGPAQEGAEPGDESARVLQEVLGRLSPRDRLVITLLHLEERTVAQTAALTGWSKTMVKVQAYRARARLRKAMEDVQGAAAMKLESRGFHA